MAGKSLDVECLSYGGYPSAEIVWHVAGVLQAEEDTLLDTFTDMETGLDVTRSTLTLDIRREDDGKVLSCELLHPALPVPLWVKSMLNVGCMYELYLSKQSLIFFTLIIYHLKPPIHPLPRKIGKSSR